MENYVIDEDIILSADNRKKYAISVGICIAIILITFFVPIISFYGQTVSIFDILGIAGTLDSLASITGTSQYIGNNYRMFVFMVFFLPVLIVTIISFINLKKTNIFYSTITIVIAVVAAVYSYIFSMVLAVATETLSSFKIGPVVVQVISYAFIAVFTFIFIREPISAQMKGKIYYGDVSYFENKKRLKKTSKVASNKSEENKRYSGNNPRMSKYEIDNIKLNDSILSIKRNIGEYIYINERYDDNIQKLAMRIDDCYEKIGENNIELLREDNRKICSNCNHISPTQSKFCSECGMKYSQDESYSREKYIEFSRTYIEIKAKNQTMINIKQENLKIREKIQEIFIAIGDIIYKSDKDYGENIDKDKMRIVSIERKMAENKQSYLKEKGLVICSNCGSEIKKDSKFCDQCGVRLNTVEINTKDELEKKN